MNKVEILLLMEQGYGKCYKPGTFINLSLAMLDAKPGMFSNLSLVTLRIQEVTNYCWRPLDFDMNTNDHLHRIFSLFG